MPYLSYRLHLPYSSIVTLYTVLLLICSLNSMAAYVDPKHRFDDYDISKTFESDSDYDAMRANVRKFDLAEPEGTKKLLTELKRAHTKNLKLQAYIGDLLDIWLFRNSVHEPNRAAPKSAVTNAKASAPNIHNNYKSINHKNFHRKEQKVSQPINKKIDSHKFENFAAKMNSVHPISAASSSLPSPSPSPSSAHSAGHPLVHSLGHPMAHSLGHSSSHSQAHSSAPSSAHSPAPFPPDAKSFSFGVHGTVGVKPLPASLPTAAAVQRKHNQLSEVLKMVTTIKHQASVVLKNACNLEMQILLANETGQGDNMDLTKQFLNNLSPIIIKNISSSAGSPNNRPSFVSSDLIDDAVKRLPIPDKKPYPYGWAETLINYFD